MRAASAGTHAAAVPKTEVATPLFRSDKLLKIGFVEGQTAWTR